MFGIIGEDLVTAVQLWSTSSVHRKRRMFGIIGGDLVTAVQPWGAISRRPWPQHPGTRHESGRFWGLSRLKFFLNQGCYFEASHLRRKSYRTIGHARRRHMRIVVFSRSGSGGHRVGLVRCYAGWRVR